MRVLAVETATAATAVALADGDHTTEVVADGSRRHTEALAPAIAALLDARGLRVADLDAIAVDVGPGLFTGLRVGVATAKALSVATGVGLVAVTSTDALAEASCAAGVTGEVCCVVDARRREVFCARYRCGPEGAVTLEDVWLSTPGDLAARLAAAGTPTTLVGDGAVRHGDVLGGAGSVTVRAELTVPSPAAATRLARRHLGAGGALLGHAAVHPRYVREADAVANFAVRAPT